MSSRCGEPNNWTQFEQTQFEKYGVFLVLLLSLSPFTINTPIILKQSIDLLYKSTDFSVMGTENSWKFNDFLS